MNKDDSSMLNKLNQFIVEDEKTAISVLKDKLKSTPLSLIYKLFRSKKIIVDSSPVRYYHHRLKKGSVLKIADKSIVFSDKKNYTKKPVEPKVNFSIEYEDKNIIIVLKNHFIETHSKNFPALSLDNAVFHYLSNFDPSFDTEDRMIISSSHRIDKLTKGLVVYAKTPYFKKMLHDLFGKKDKIKKKYLAVCYGRLKKDQFFGNVEGFVYKDENVQKIIFNFEETNQNSKKCSMHVERIFSKFDYHVFEITLFTGRKHQIRSFFSFVGMPIIGDEKYGSSLKLKNKIKLFAYSIEFENMPKELSYLNTKKFEIFNMKKTILSQISSSNINFLPRKFIKN